MEDSSLLRMSSQDTVQQGHETDPQFLQYLRKIVDKKNTISPPQIFAEHQFTFTEHDYELIDEMACSHAQANILNSTSSKEFKEIRQMQKCRCGCGKGFGQLLPFFFNEQKLSILGSGVILFFFYLRHMRILLLFTFFFFSTFSIIANMTFSNFLYDCSHTSLFLTEGICIYNETSTFNEISQYKFLRNFQLWLGFCCSIVWIIGVRLITQLGMKKDQQIDQSLNSASDYSLRIENLPYGEYNQYQLLDYLNQLAIEQPYPLEILSLQIIYNMDESRKLIAEIRELAEQVLETIEQNSDSRIAADQIQTYKTVKKLLISKLKQFENRRLEFKTNGDYRKRSATTIALAEFPNPDLLNDFIKIINSSQNPLEETLMPNNSILFKGKRLVIKRAPEPSDIMWNNCEKNVSVFRSIMIWLSVLMVLYVGYAIISYSQTLPFVRLSIGIVASAILQLFNRLIWLILSFLVTYEHNNTKTEAMISLMKKSILAQAINIIVTPMISKFVNGRALYGDMGVSGMALTYQFVMMIMMLFYYIFNPLQLGSMLMLKLKCVRNWIIRKNCLRGKSSSDEMDLSKVFAYYEGPDFPVAGAYVYMTTATFHGLFYCHLQPVILLLVVINMSIFTVILKYMLYRRCKIPELTHVQVFEFAMFMISWGAVFYAMGSIFFVIIDADINLTNSVELVLPSFLVLIIWFISTLNVCGIFRKIDEVILRLIKAAHSEAKVVHKTEFRGTIHADKMVDELSDPDANKINVWSRKQCYYTNCNTNILLDFQKQLLQRSDKYSSKGLSLRKFCQGFNTVETFAWQVNPPKMSDMEASKMSNAGLQIENSTNFLKLKTIYHKSRKFDLIPVILIGPNLSENKNEELQK